VKLTIKDRVILINQYDILSKLDADNASHYEKLINILKHGYEIYYNELTNEMSESMPESECAFVLHILDIYRIFDGYRRKYPDDRDFADHSWTFFKGFDANSESKYWSFTRFVILDKNLFGEQLKHKKPTDGFNAHMPVLDKYQRMISQWTEFGRKFELTKDEIYAILDA
jgi:uncharacterized protein YfbU (UPF0304 family)